MTRDRIFTAAKALLAQEGLSGLSIRKIARDVGLSPMAVYRHFADKEAIINALMQDGIGAWEDRVMAIEASDPLIWLDDQMNAFLAFALDEPHRFDAAFFLPASKARQFPEDFAAGRSKGVGLMIAHIEMAQRSGRIDTTPALDIALTLVALAQGMVSMHRARRFSTDEQFQSLFRATLRRSLACYRIATPVEASASAATP